MINLRNILLVGSLLLTRCAENPNLLTEGEFQKAEWASVPFRGEIWNSYMGEEIPKYEKNWEIYQRMVAQKNNFRYVEKNGLTYIIGVKEKTILLPDLDGDNYIKYTKIDSIKVEEVSKQK